MSNRRRFKSKAEKAREAAAALGPEVLAALEAEQARRAAELEALPPRARYYQQRQDRRERRAQDFGVEQ